MTRLLALALFGVTLAAASPASAQMCGGNVGQAGTADQSGVTAQSGGMCGGMMGQRQSIPTAEEMLEGKPAKPQQAGMMCACCRNMAMMRGGQQGGQGGDHGNMPGMDMPKQQ